MIACLRLTHFAATVEQRQHPATTALLIARYHSGRSKIVATSIEAEQAGVKSGMAVSRARALCPDAQIVSLIPSRYRRALLCILDLLCEYSQWLDHERHYVQTAIIYMDLGKLKPSVGQHLARQMVEQLRSQYGMTAQVGLAANKFTAYAAALKEQAQTVTLVPRGEEATFLAPLPIQYLPLDSETEHRLSLFGLRTLGQLAALPRDALLAQFGKTGGMLHRFASGEDGRRVAKYIPEQVASEAFMFEPAVDDRCILDNVLRHLSQRLAAQLETQNLTCRDITLTLSLEGGEQVEERIRLTESKGSAVAVHRAAQGLMHRMAIQSAVCRVELRLAHLSPLLPRQLSLFEDSAPQKLQALLIDLAIHYDDTRFYTAVVHPRATLPELRFSLEGIDVA
jgi:DNA polymerase-4